MTAVQCDAPAAPRLRRASLASTLVRGVLLGWAVAWVVLFVNLFVADNLRVVVPGRIYRSSQVSAESLDRFARRLGIRTVINLRGYGAGLGWYAEESRTCSRLGLSQEDLGFSAGRLPAVSEIRRLVEVIDRSEHPILFHCYRGVDRTGMASVVALLLESDATLDEALRELAIRHIHLPFGRTGNLDRFFGMYRDWLESQNWEHAPARFRHWVLREYRGGANTGRIEMLGSLLIGPEKQRLPAPSGSLPLGPNARVVLRVPCNLPAGLPLRFHNTSCETWVFHPGNNAGMHAYWRLLDDQGRLLHLVRAGRFHARVRPGESIDLILTLPPLRSPGKLHLQACMVEEQHTLFNEVGMPILDVDLEVL